MNTTSRSLLILFLLIAWGLYTFLVYRGFHDTLCSECGSTAAITADTINRYDLAFKWQSPQPYANEGFSATRDDLQSKATETNILEIVGQYLPGETAKEEAEALGLARAKAIRDSFFADLPDFKIRLSSAEADQKPANAENGFFEAAGFDFINLENPHALGFLWSNPKPFATAAFDPVKDSIQALMGSDNILEITGLYYDSETTPEGSDNIGLERAKQIRAQFFPNIPDDQIRLRARANPDVASAKRNYFESVIFEWINPEETKTETVEELADRIIIRFPTNSDEKIYDPKVDEYLLKLAERVQETGEAITIVGHTDNEGTAEFNMDLGLQRATRIREILIKDGVKADLIEISSKGEQQPVASNDTEEGRYENRRAEVRLIKKEN